MSERKKYIINKLKLIAKMFIFYIFETFFGFLMKSSPSQYSSSYFSLFNRISNASSLNPSPNKPHFLYVGEMQTTFINCNVLICLWWAWKNIFVCKGRFVVILDKDVFILIIISYYVCCNMFISLEDTV